MKELFKIYFIKLSSSGTRKIHLIFPRSNILVCENIEKEVVFSMRQINANSLKFQDGFIW